MKRLKVISIVEFIKSQRRLVKMGARSTSSFWTTIVGELPGSESEENNSDKALSMWSGSQGNWIFIERIRTHTYVHEVTSERCANYSLLGDPAPSAVDNEGETIKK